MPKIRSGKRPRLPAKKQPKASTQKVRRDKILPSHPKAKTKIVFGLGNPDPRYEDTWHNIGLFLVRSQTAAFNPHRNVSTARFSLSKSLFLALPLVYVNQAGEAVRELRRIHPWTPQELLVVHDDADLQFPYAKLSFGASAAGHRGVQSIIDVLKTEKFWRLRIGIQTSKKRKDAMDIVLKKLKPEEQRRLTTMAKKFGGVLQRLAKESPDKLSLPRDYFA